MSEGGEGGEGGEHRGISSEEEDLLSRSTKKAKGVDGMEFTNDVGMTEEGGGISRRNIRLEEEGSGVVSVKGINEGRKVVSYKEKLVGFNGDTYMDEDEFEGMMMENEEEESLGEEGEAGRLEEGDPACPVISVSHEERVELCRPWRRALFIKLMGKRLGMRFLKMRLQKMWAMNDFEFIDMENDYYLVRFQEVKDYNFVLQEGPWVIADHYLIVQRWSPNFNPYEDDFRKTAIWARVPGLPIEFYNKHFLWKLGNRIGRTVKVDTNTLRRKDNGEEDMVERAKFARICVEVDLQKRFLSKFRLMNRTYRVEYEGLHLICFHCGRYGHKKEECLEVLQAEDSRVHDNIKEGNEMTLSPVQGVIIGEEAFGPWMIAQKGRRGRKGARLTGSKELERLGSKSGSNLRYKEKGPTNGNGSRFTALMVNPEDMEAGEKEEGNDMVMEVDNPSTPSINNVMHEPCMTAGMRSEYGNMNSTGKESRVVKKGSNAKGKEVLIEGDGRNGLEAVRGLRKNQREHSVLRSPLRSLQLLPSGMQNSSTSSQLMNSSLVGGNDSAVKENLAVLGNIDVEVAKLKPPDRGYTMNYSKQGVQNGQAMDREVSGEAIEGQKVVFEAI